MPNYEDPSSHPSSPVCVADRSCNPTAPKQSLEEMVFGCAGVVLLAIMFIIAVSVGISSKSWSAFFGAIVVEVLLVFAALWGINEIKASNQRAAQLDAEKHEFQQRIAPHLASADQALRDMESSLQNAENLTKRSNPTSTKIK